METAFKASRQISSPVLENILSFGCSCCGYFSQQSSPMELWEDIWKFRGSLVERWKWVFLVMGRGRRHVVPCNSLGTAFGNRNCLPVCHLVLHMRNTHKIGCVYSPSISTRMSCVYVCVCACPNALISLSSCIYFRPTRKDWFSVPDFASKPPAHACCFPMALSVPMSFVLPWSVSVAA